MGAYMMVRSAVLAQVGLFDERFFMYGEDIDLCYRIKQGGWKIYYHPVGRLLHLKGESSRKRSYRMIHEFHRAMQLFYSKHYAPQNGRVLNTLVHLGILIRELLSLFRNSLRRSKRVA